MEGGGGSGRGGRPAGESINNTTYIPVYFPTHMYISQNPRFLRLSHPIQTRRHEGGGDQCACRGQEWSEKKNIFVYKIYRRIYCKSWDINFLRSIIRLSGFGVLQVLRCDGLGRATPCKLENKHKFWSVGYEPPACIAHTVCCDRNGSTFPPDRPPPTIRTFPTPAHIFPHHIIHNIPRYARAYVSKVLQPSCNWSRGQPALLNLLATGYCSLCLFVCYFPIYILFLFLFC